MRGRTAVEKCLVGCKGGCLSRDSVDAFFAQACVKETLVWMKKGKLAYKGKCAWKGAQTAKAKVEATPPISYLSC